MISLHTCLRRVVRIAAALLLAGCATVQEPYTLVLSPEDIERQLATDLGSVLELFRDLDARRPEVGLMPGSGRLQLSWGVAVPGNGPGGVLGAPLRVEVDVSGEPRLAPGGQSVDLALVRIDDVRVDGMPRLFGLGFARLVDQKGASLPDFPLLAIPAERLRRGHVVYGATGVGVTWRGLRVDLAPR